MVALASDLACGPGSATIQSLLRNANQFRFAQYRCVSAREAVSRQQWVDRDDERLLMSCATMAGMLSSRRRPAAVFSLRCLAGQRPLSATAKNGFSRPRAVFRSEVCASQRCGATDSAHVPRPGCSPGLLLYFAASATPHPWPEPHAAFGPENSRRWWIGTAGRSAQRSKGGGSGAARDGGHERSRAPGRSDLAPMSATGREHHFGSPARHPSWVNRRRAA